MALQTPGGEEEGRGLENQGEKTISKISEGPGGVPGRAPLLPRSVHGARVPRARHGPHTAWPSLTGETYLRFFMKASSRLSLRIWIIPSSRLRRASSASMAFLKPFLRASVRDEGRSILTGCCRVAGEDARRRGDARRCGALSSRSNRRAIPSGSPRASFCGAEKGAGRNQEGNWGQAAPRLCFLHPACGHFKLEGRPVDHTYKYPISPLSFLRLRRIKVFTCINNQISSPGDIIEHEKNEYRYCTGTSGSCMIAPNIKLVY